MNTVLMGGPADGRRVDVDTDRLVFEVAVINTGSGEYASERYRRHRVLDPSLWGREYCVYAHHTLTANDVTERLNA